MILFFQACCHLTYFGLVCFRKDSVSQKFLLKFFLATNMASWLKTSIMSSKESWQLVLSCGVFLENRRINKQNNSPITSSILPKSFEVVLRRLATHRIIIRHRWEMKSRVAKSLGSRAGPYFFIFGRRPAYFESQLPLSLVNSRTAPETSPYLPELS